MTFKYEEPTGYAVESTFDKGQTWTNVYKGQDREEAVRIANFWDEKVDTHFFDFNNLPQDAMSVANRKFDALEAYLKTA